MVPELMAIAIRDFWRKIGSISHQLAVDMQRPKAFQNIEYLFNQIHMKEITHSQTGI